MHAGALAEHGHALTPATLAPVWRELATEAAQRFGTPAYITRWKPVEETLRALDASLEAESLGVRIRSWLSWKTHPLPALLQAWRESGRGVEVVSEYELVAARQLGCSPDELLVNGLAKHRWLPRYNLPRLHVHFDSLHELDALLPCALEQHWRVGVRVHAPDEGDTRDPTFGGPFGMSSAEAVEALDRLRIAGADLRSLHFHLGQGRARDGAYRRGVEQLIGVSETAGFAPSAVDLGGSLPPAPHASEKLADLRAAVAAATRAFAPALQEVWLENGRHLTSSAGVLVVRVVDTKNRSEGRYLICDGGRTNHALAADHGLHPLLTVPERSGPARLTTLCGPTCMTDDTLGRLLLPETVTVGDLIVWGETGAYHLPWETRFSHGLCAVAWCDADDRLKLVREREHPNAWLHAWTR